MIRIILLLSLFITGSCMEAVAETIQDGRAWVNLTGQGRLRKDTHWRWYFDIQARTRDGVGNVDQFVARPGIGYSVTRRSTVWAGFAYTANYPASGGVLNESRMWEQFSWQDTGTRGTLSVRSRLEQRYFPGTNMAWRARQQVRYSWLLKSHPRLSPILWEELMAHLNASSRAVGGFDQSRTFAGIGVQANSNVRLESGYMNQTQRTKTSYRMNHVFSTIVSLTF